MTENEKLDYKLLEEVASKFITLTQASEISGLSEAHLRRLIYRGAIWATKVGINWVTTEESVRDYLKTDRRTGPKTKQ